MDRLYSFLRLIFAMRRARSIFPGIYHGQTAIPESRLVTLTDRVGTSPAAESIRRPAPPDSRAQHLGTLIEGGQQTSSGCFSHFDQLLQADQSLTSGLDATGQTDEVQASA
jgi:hypothetical protein